MLQVNTFVPLYLQLSTCQTTVCLMCEETRIPNDVVYMGNTHHYNNETKSKVRG